MTYLEEIFFEFCKEQEEYNAKMKEYDSFIGLPWYKRALRKKVEKPSFSRFFALPLLSNYRMRIECRLYFCGNKREISIAINENGYGYKIDVFSFEREPLIGSKGMEVSYNASMVVLNFCNRIAEMLG